MLHLVQGADREESQLRGSQTPNSTPQSWPGPGVSAGARSRGRRPRAGLSGLTVPLVRSPQRPLPSKSEPRLDRAPLLLAASSLDRSLLLQASLPRVMSPLASACTSGCFFLFEPQAVLLGGGAFQQHLLESGGIAGRKPSLATGSA